MTYVEMKTALECHAKKKYCCEECPINTDDDCSIDLAKKVLEVLNAKAEPLDQRQMVLKTVMMALDKGGYSVTVTPDGEVRMMPWGETARLIKDDTQSDIWHCSACGKEFGWVSKTFKFCPNCGAAMEDDNEDD